MEFEQGKEIPRCSAQREDDEMWVRQVVSCKTKGEMRRRWRRGRIGSKDMERECEAFGAIEKKRVEAT